MNKINGFLVALAASVLTSPVSSEMVTWSFNGTVNSPGLVASVGDTVTGTITFDTDAPKKFGAVGYYESYQDSTPSNSLKVTVNDVTYQHQNKPSTPLDIWVYQSPYYYRFDGGNITATNNDVIKYAEIVIETTRPLPNTLTIPLLPPKLGHGRISIGGPNGEFIANITAVSPVPVLKPPVVADTTENSYRGILN